MRCKLHFFMGFLLWKAPHFIGLFEFFRPGATEMQLLTILFQVLLTPTCIAIRCVESKTHEISTISSWDHLLVNNTLHFVWRSVRWSPFSHKNIIFRIGAFAKFIVASSGKSALLLSWATSVSLCC